MKGNYTSDAKNACRVSYGKLSESYTKITLYGLAPELANKDKIYTKTFVDDVLCDKENPLLLVDSNPFHSIPTDIELRNALTCLTMIRYPQDKNSDPRKNTEYSNKEIRKKLIKFVDEYLNRNPGESKRQKIVDECTRTADPIDVLSECKNNCMFDEYKTTTGKRVFFPHDALQQLKLLRNSIIDDLSFVNSLLKDSGKIKVAQLHKFRGKDARKDNLKRPDDTSKTVAQKLKRKYGARGQAVKSSSAAVANRLKKQRKKKIRDLFALVQTDSTEGVNDALKEYFTMNRVLNLDTKSLRMNRNPGEGNYYRPAKKRQTTPELRLKKKAIDSIMKRYKNDPTAFGAKSLLEKEFPKLNRPLRLKGAGVTQGGNRKDYSRLSQFDVRERQVPKNDRSTISVTSSDKKGKGFEIDVCGAGITEYCLYQHDIDRLHGMTMRDLRDPNSDEIVPFIASGDYIKQKRNNKTTYLRLEIKPTEQKMILGPMGQKLLDIPDVSTLQSSNENSNPIDVSTYPLRLADGSAKTFKEMLKYLSTLIQNKFIEAVLRVKKLQKSGSKVNAVPIDKRIAMDKEIYLPEAITVVKRKGVSYIGLIVRDKSNNENQNKFMLQLPNDQQYVDIIGQRMTREFEEQHIRPKEDGVYFILHKKTRLGSGAQVLDAPTASAKLRRYARDMNLKDLSEDLKMWATKNQTDTRDVMLSPISPILDYVREKKGKSRLNYKYNEKLQGAREKERRRRLPLPKTKPPPPPMPTVGPYSPGMNDFSGLNQYGTQLRQEG